MKNSLFKKVLIFLSSLAVVLCAVCFFAFQNIKSRNSDAAMLQRTLDLQSSQDQYILSVKRDVSTSNNDVEQVNNSILGQQNTVDFIEALESTAKKQGLTISIDSLNIVADPSLSTSTMTTLDVKADTKGDWPGTYTFVSQIESMPYTVRVANISLRQVSDGDLKKGAAPQWEADFEINVLTYAK